MAFGRNWLVFEKPSIVDFLQGSKYASAEDIGAEAWGLGIAGIFLCITMNFSEQLLFCGVIVKGSF